MLKRYIFLLLFIPLVLFSQGAESFIWRNYTTQDKFTISSRDTCFQLSHPYLMPGSERVFFTGKSSKKKIDITFDYVKGKLCLKSGYSVQDTITVYYSYYPFMIPPEWKKNKLVDYTDSLTNKKAQKIVPEKADAKGEKYFRKLNKSGSITRGFTIGTNRSMTLQSGLNFQISGKIAENVVIDANLTDENTPIQPEGNTQNLSEIDKVFIRVNSPNVSAVIGDYYFSQQALRLNSVNRKLQGIQMLGKYDGHNAGGLFATSNGQFHTNSFTGQEGNQGPYRLKGKNGEINIVVLAGTERVFINGNRMQRGENYDYVIDYSLGEIKFTQQRPVKGNDRVVVDFEYTSYDRQFGKNDYGMEYSYDKNKNFNLKMVWFRESDDPDKPLYGNNGLSEEEKNVLANAGDDPLKAVINGVKFVGEGKGNYRDSLASGVADTIYVYAGNGNGSYIITFSDVGEGNGDYRRETLGVYKYVGKGGGSFLPVRAIPLPQQYDMFGFKTNGKIGDFTSDLELNLTNHDKNKLSGLNNSDNDGFSGLWNLKYENMKVPILGHLRVKQYVRYKNKNFTSLDRLDRPDYQSRWGLTQVSQNTGSEELVGETSIFFKPAENFNLNLDGGYRENRTLYRSMRGSERFSLLIKDSLTIQHDFALMKSDYYGSGQSNTFALGNFMLRNGWKNISASLRGSYELRKEHLPASWNRGWRNYKIYAGTYWHEGDFNLFLNGGADVDDAVLYDKWNGMSDNWDVSAGTELKSESGQGHFSWYHRERKVSDRFNKLSSAEKELFLNHEYVDTSLVNRKSDLVKVWWRQRIEYLNADMRLDYQVGAEQSPLMDKFYLPVQNHNGNFRYDSTLSQWVPDPNGTHVLVLLPTGNYKPVTNVRASVGFNWLGRGMFSPLQINRSSFKKFINGLKLNFFWQVEEQSKSEELAKLYLLMPSVIQSDSTLRSNISLRNDLYWYFSKKRDYFNLRYQFQSSMNRQYVASADNDFQESYRLDFIYHLNLNTRLKNDFSLIHRNSQKKPSSPAIKPEDITGNGLEEKLTWRFYRNWTQSFSLETVLERNDITDNFIRLLFTQFSWQMIVPWAGKGRVQLDFKRLSVDVLESDPGYTIPFNMAKGKKEGVSMNWGVIFGYSLSNNINISLQYTGRKDAVFRKVLHTGRAEVKAYL